VSVGRHPPSRLSFRGREYQSCRERVRQSHDSARRLSNAAAYRKGFRGKCCPVRVNNRWVFALSSRAVTFLQPGAHHLPGREQRLVCIHS